MNVEVYSQMRSSLVGKSTKVLRRRSNEICSDVLSLFRQLWQNMLVEKKPEEAGSSSIAQNQVLSIFLSSDYIWGEVSLGSRCCIL